ncbi:MAG: serine O-acetyltransferase [Dehalococcoidia bacterium]|nr:serine O-acetyltransferase [Dehalococcoidia bacterium]
MGLWQSIRRDLRACLDRDPAARSALEVVLTYPGFHARQWHRLAHALWRANVPLLPRLIAHGSRFLTGIEIHPAARIGEGLFIDHGMGVVIGETAVIGDDCTLHQGVTLGGVSTQRTKRHPTLGNNVVVGAGAQLLGAITIGDNVKVGAGSVVVQNVPPNATVVGVPGRIVAIRDDESGATERLPDPVAETIHALVTKVIDLEMRLAALEGRSAEPPAPMAEIAAIVERLTTPPGGRA